MSIQDGATKASISSKEESLLDEDLRFQHNYSMITQEMKGHLVYSLCEAGNTLKP